MKTTTGFYATLEHIRSDEAIVTLFDADGEWSGAGLVQVKSCSKSDIYEEGYRMASVSARAKGGRIETYRVVG